MADFMEHVEALTETIGPRPVSTEEERQASEYIANQLTDLGLEVDVDEFATPTGTRWPFVVAFCAIAAGTLISGFGMFIDGLALPMYVIGLVLVVAAFVVYYLERNNRQVLSQRRAGGISQNVVARYVPSSVARERKRRKIIICAHVDTVRAEPLAHPKLVNYCGLLRTIMFYVMIGLVALFVVRLLPIPWPSMVDMALWIISLVACVFVLAAAAAIGATRFMPFVAGGNDNASAAAVMLNVARLTCDPAERERCAAEMNVYNFSDFAEEEEVDVAGEDGDPSTSGLRPSAQDDGVVEGAYARSASSRAERSEVEGSLDAAASAPASGLPLEGGAVGADAPTEGVTATSTDVAIHGADAAYEADVVPEGAELEYAEGAAPAELPDITMVMPVVSDDDVQSSADSEAAADETTLSVSAAQGAAEPAPPERGSNEGAAPADADDSDGIFEMDFLAKLGQEFAGEDGDPSTSGLRPSAQDDGVVEGAYAPFAQDDGVVEGAHARSASSRAERSEVEGSPDAAASAPAEPVVYKKNPVVVDPNVPSWYAAARQKAAASQAGEPTASEPSSFRSRYADVPMTIEQPETATDESDAASDAGDPSTSGLRPSAQDDGVVEGAHARSASSRAERSEVEGSLDAAASAPVSGLPLEGGAVGADAPTEGVTATADTAASAPASIFQIDDDALDDIAFDDDIALANPESAHHAVAARIPSIGNSGEKVPRYVVPNATEDGTQAQCSPYQGELSRECATEGANKAASAGSSAAPKRERRKPTARRVTGSFQPTRVIDEREEIVSPELRQAAPIQSSYEATPQAGLSAEMPAVEAEPAASEPIPAAAVAASKTSSFPSLTGSFPALTGSFPSLTGNIPIVGADPLPEQSFDAFAPNQAAMTGTIDIPESRFHNVVDKAGGLFSKFGRKKKNTADNEISWGEEEDDFGWKGGGYFTDDAGVMDAARRRAAEIRESVISMTEEDLLDKEVWFVALGASNASGQGMKNFLDLHQSELRGALIINLEAVGAGSIHYVESEGTGKSHRADRRLTNLVKRASRELSGHEIKPRKLDYRNTDATPAMLAGMRAITIMGFDDAAPVAWHWSTDTADVVEERKLEFTSKLLMRVIENS